jgi:hypothetical protein
MAASLSFLSSETEIVKVSGGRMSSMVPWKLEVLWRIEGRDFAHAVVGDIMDLDEDMNEGFRNSGGYYVSYLCLFLDPFSILF